MALAFQSACVVTRPDYYLEKDRKGTVFNRAVRVLPIARFVLLRERRVDEMYRSRSKTGGTDGSAIFGEAKTSPFRKRSSIIRDRGKL